MTKAYIIAECGIEHLGQIKLAEQLIDAAKFAGADCVKFQLYSVETARKVDNGDGPLTKYRLDRAAMQGLWNYSKDAGIDFLLSAFDMDSLKSCKDMGLTAVKIPSVCNENMDMIDYAVDNFCEVFISCGLIDDDTELKVIPVRAGVKKLLCTSAYPCPFDAVNLSAGRFGERYSGLSDHTIGVTVSIMAVALGAQIIEKHFTLERKTGGPDCICSLEPGEFMNLVGSIRDAEAALGTGVKKVMECEKPLLWRKK